MINNAEQTAALFNAFKDRKRVTAFVLLAEGAPGKEVAEELDISRPSLQYYIQDFKELGLLRSEGNSYLLTEKGERFQNLLKQVSEIAEN